MKKSYKKKLLNAVISTGLALLTIGCGQQNNSNSNVSTMQSEISENQISSSSKKRKIEKNKNIDGTSSPIISSSSLGNNFNSNLLNNASYALGYTIGSNISSQLKSQDILLNNTEFMDGIQTSIVNKNSKFTQTEMQNIIQSFQQEIIKKQNLKQLSAIIEYSNQLLNTKQTPTIGPKDSPVTVIKFFDYNCLFCSKMNPIMDKIINSNPNIQYIFKEFPIFGKNWKASQYASEIGIATYLLNDSNKYLKYHNEIFSNFKGEGKLLVEDINKIALDLKIDIEKAKKLIKEQNITNKIKDDLFMGTQKLGIQGTPIIIIMPTKGANINNTTIISGISTDDKLQEAINKAQKSVHK